MQIPERVKKIGRIARTVFRIGFITIGCLSLATILIVKFDRPAQTSKSITIQDEIFEQTRELNHRIKLCDEMIDSMNPSPDYQNMAAFHCGMMWVQMKKLEAFVTAAHVQDPTASLMVVETFRTAARYAEYQKAINQPFFKPSSQE